MLRRKATAVPVIVALFAALALAGCSRTIPIAPAPELAAGPEVVAPQPPSQLSALSVPLPLPDLNLLNWRTMISITVAADEDRVVESGRYQLRFSKGSLSKDETITISEYDEGIIDVQLGPHGTRFGTPVEFSIDFSGTAADPKNVTEQTIEPVLWYLNEKENVWEEVPGTTDWKNCRHIVHLEHFSRYALGGKAGWRDGDHPRESAE